MIKGVLFLLTTLVISSTFAAAKERRVALVIGNSNYDGSYLNTLKYPRNDAYDMAKALTQLGFEVVSGYDLTLKQMHNKVRAFNKLLLSKDKENTVGLFFYAGHGIEVDGENYLLPLDAEIEYKEDANSEAQALSKILTRMRNSKNRMNIVILDACRTNPFSGMRGGVKANGWGSISAKAEGMFIAYGTSKSRGAVDDGGNQRNGLFTKHLLKNIKTPGITIEKTFKAVRAGVLKDSHKKIITEQSNFLIGDFYFNPQQSAVSALPEYDDTISSASLNRESSTYHKPDKNQNNGQIFFDEMMNEVSRKPSTNFENSTITTNYIKQDDSAYSQERIKVMLGISDEVKLESSENLSSSTNNDKKQDKSTSSGGYLQSILGNANEKKSKNEKNN